MSNTPVIPETLISQLLEDQVVLFLGAGANCGVRNAADEKIPLGTTLRDMLCDKFLGGNLKDRPLGEIADYVINEADLTTLQEYLYSIFKEFEPADYHLLIPELPWLAIFSTNYDLIIEKAYEKCAKRVREIEPFVKNGDKIDVKLKRKHDLVQYVKLHGCINHYRDHSIPLVLSNEQISRHSSGRDRLFQRFRDLGHQCSVVFCGYSVADPNIRDILFDLKDTAVDRPRYYLVKPNIDQYFRRYWEANRFTVIDSDFAPFLRALISRTTEHERKLATFAKAGSTTLKKFYRTTTPVESPDLKRFLQADVTHVYPGMPVTAQTAKDFYSGYDRGWWAFEQGLDIYRDIIDSIIVESVLKPLDQDEGVDLFVVKGPAGNGKTVTLKRTAWEAANSYDQIVLYLNEGGSLNRQCLQDIFDLTGKRIVLFIDHVALCVDETAALIEFSKGRKIKLTVVASERDNEWNVRCDALERYLTNEFSIGYLSPKEIRLLIDKLEKHGCLGELKEKSAEARIAAFTERAQRQLLVALHEVTSGVPFEKIIKDEYDRIIPDDAKYLYLDVCTLNRFAVPVRAGLIARISGISFERFQRELFSPLEHLVRVQKHPYIQDHLYESRHAHVAELVFSQALVASEERFEQVVRIMRGMNIDYSSDNEAFHALLKGRAIADTFPSVELGRKIFAVAHDVAKENAFVSHQEAVFEMSHAAGSLARALKVLEKAAKLAPWDRSIQHSIANAKRKLALAANTALERDKLRSEAKALLSGDSKDHQSFGLYTQCQLLVDEMEDLLRMDFAADDPALAVTDRRITDLIKSFEQAGAIAAQRFPKNEQFSVLEARFHGLLDKSEKADRALNRAFTTNPRNEFVASQLAARLGAQGKAEDAKKILSQCLDANPGARHAHLKMAQLLMRQGEESNRILILDHLRKSFTDGDANLVAQFWYARALFLNGQYVDAQVLFRKLYQTPMPPGLRNELRGMIKSDSGIGRVYQGEMITFEMSYGFIRTSSFVGDLYTVSHDSDSNAWSEVHRFARVCFQVGFTMKGPRALCVEVLK